MIPLPPPLWVTLAQLWQLSDAEARRGWQALYRAKYPVAAGFRQRLVHFEGQTAYERLHNVDAFVREHLTPADVMETLEALAAEGLLGGRDRILIEEKVLGCLDASGHWMYPHAGQMVGDIPSDHFSDRIYEDRV